MHFRLTAAPERQRFADLTKGKQLCLSRTACPPSGWRTASSCCVKFCVSIVGYGQPGVVRWSVVSLVDSQERIVHGGEIAAAPALFSLSGDGRGQGAIWHSDTGTIASKCAATRYLRLEGGRTHR